MAKKMKSDPPELLPMLMPASMMAKVSGIGEATLRTLMAQGKSNTCRSATTAYSASMPSGPITKPIRHLLSLLLRRGLTLSRK